MEKVVGGAKRTGESHSVPTNARSAFRWRKMTMDDLGCFGWIVMIVAFVVALWVGKVIFEAVMASDMPNWLKYMILR